MNPHALICMPLPGKWPDHPDLARMLVHVGDALHDVAENCTLILRYTTTIQQG